MTTTADLLYNPSKRNMRLREKIDNEMFINRSVSQEAAYDYITKIEKSIKRKSCSIIPTIGIFVMFFIYIGVLIFK
jgi:hypothetical protein